MLSHTSAQYRKVPWFPSLIFFWLYREYSGWEEVPDAVGRWWFCSFSTPWTCKMILWESPSPQSSSCSLEMRLNNSWFLHLGVIRRLVSSGYILIFFFMLSVVLCSMRKGIWKSACTSGWSHYTTVLFNFLLLSVQWMQHSQSSKPINQNLIRYYISLV